jgi:amidophosphoribosyltransferase
MKHGITGLREACGLVAVSGPGARAGVDLPAALAALQHRGQDGAGAAVLGSEGAFTLQAGAGRVAEVFPRGLEATPADGQAGLGHVRYATSGPADASAVQPLVGHGRDGTFALAHNGHVARFAPEAAGAEAGSDSQRLVAIIADDPDRSAEGITSGRPEAPEERWVLRLSRLFTMAHGAWSIAVLTPVGVFAARDPFGVRPLQLGRRDGPGGPTHLVASESCAFDAIGAIALRDVAPGEIVWLGPDGPRSLHIHRSRAQSGFCSFEYVYFASATSAFGGRPVADVRTRLGRALAHEAPAAADLVIAVPDASSFAARAYADTLGLPFVAALRRDPDAGRSFIASTSERRTAIAEAKLELDATHVAGQRIVVVDDSLVRGTTARQVVVLLRAAGATAIHLRVASPPVVDGCHLGVDIPDRTELFAATHAGSDPDDGAARLGVASLAYLSHKAMLGAMEGASGGYCSGCFGGAYPALPRPTGCAPR